MDEEIVTEETGTEVESPGTEVASGGNPAWNDFLSQIPSSMHDMVKPHLQKWDSGVQEKIQSVHSQYADFKPYMEAGINRDLIDQSLQVFDALNTNPQEVYRILSETYGQPTGQGQIEPEEKEQVAEHDIPGGQFNPEMNRLQQMTETMAQIILQQETAKQEAADDAELDSELKSLEKKFGAFDETFVLGYMQAGMEGEAAVKAFHSMRNEILSNHNRPGAPNVISGSGQLPSNAINPSGLNDKDTRNLVANMFKAANQQGA